MKCFMSRHYDIVFTRDKKVKKFIYDMTDATQSYIITNERLIENRIRFLISPNHTLYYTHHIIK